MSENEAIKKIQYRINTASEVVGKGADGKAFEDLEMAIQALEERQQYRAIGTVDEFKALNEKSVAKKVVVEHIPKTSWTKEISHYLCPCCNHIFSFGGTTYCPNCGQKLYWQ